MDERDRDRQAIDAAPDGTGRRRAGVENARAGVGRVRGAAADATFRIRDAGGDAASRFRETGEDAAWVLRERVVWPAQDGLEALGPRGQIGVFGGGGIAVAGVVAALLIAGGGGSGSGGGTTEAFVVPERTPAITAVAPAPKPKKQKAAKPTGPTLHGAPPDFSAAQDVKSGVGDGKAVGQEAVSGETGGVSAERGANGAASSGAAATASASDAPASSAKIGSTPTATASAAAQAESLANEEASGAARNGAAAGTSAPGNASGTAGEDESELSGPPAPKAAKRVARHFAEAFVVYETGGVDAKVRSSFRHTTTKQLSKALLQRPPRQPAAVKVPQAKVVTVVAGPSKGSVYEVSVSLLRVGVTSELRLAMEQGLGKKWQVTNVLG
jgi:hypothetical protein